MSYNFLQNKRKQEKKLDFYSDSSLIEEPVRPKEDYDNKEKKIHLSKKATSERSWDLEAEHIENFIIENPELNAPKPSSRNVFEKRKRHKTSEGRYDTEKKRKNRNNSNFNNSKRVKSTRWQSQKKVPWDIIRKFRSKKIGQSRITLQMSYSRGLFKNGRASSHVGRRGIPDLSFSEMEFLRNSKKTIQADTKSSPVKTKYINKNTSESIEKDDEISVFFRPSINSQQVFITPELRCSPKEIRESKSTVMSSPRSKNISSNCDIKNNLLRAENRPGPMDKVHTPARELSLDNRNIISVGDKFQSTTFSKELSFNTPEAGYNAMIPVRQSSNSVQKIKFDQTLATEIDEASISEMVDPFHKASSKIRNISNSHRLDPDHESENDIRDDKTIRMLLEKSHWIDGLENQSELRQKKDKVILAHYADQKTSLRPHNYTLILSSAENLNELAQINRPATTLPVIRVSPAEAAPAKKIYDTCKQNLENKIAVKISSPIPHITFGQNKEESRPSCVPKENYRTTDRLKNHSNPGFYDSDYNDYRLTSSRKSNEDIGFSSAYGEQEKRCEKNQHSIQNFAGDYNNRPDSISPRDYHQKVPNQTIESCPNSPIDNLSSSILAVNKEKHEEKYYFLSQVDPYQDSYQCFSCEDFDTFNFDMGLNEKLFSVKDTGKSTADYNTYDTIDQKADQYIDLDNDQSIYSNSDLAQHEQSYCTYLESNKLNTIFHNETTDNLNGFTSHETSKKKNTSIDTPGYFSWQKSAGFEDLSYFRRCPEDLKEIEDFWCVHRQY